MVNEVFRECNVCARAVFCWFLFFSLFLKRKQDVPFSLSLSVFEQASHVNVLRWLMTSVFFHTQFVIMSECTHIRPLFWWWRFLSFFLFPYIVTGCGFEMFDCVSGGRCLHCQHNSVFLFAPRYRGVIVWHRYTDTGHSLWSNIKRCCWRHRGYMWNSLEWKKELCGSLTWCYQSND